MTEGQRFLFRRILVWKQTSSDDDELLADLIDQLSGGQAPPQTDYPPEPALRSGIPNWLAAIVALVWAVVVLAVVGAIILGSTAWDDVSTPFMAVNTVFSGVTGYYIGTKAKRN